MTARAPDLPAVLLAQADAIEAHARAQADTLRALARALAVGAVMVAPSPQYATARSNPIGSERGFKAACASGAFAVFKQGRQVAARWEDVAAYVESRTRPARAMAPTDPDRAELASMGVRLRAANDRGRR